MISSICMWLLRIEIHMKYVVKVSSVMIFLLGSHTASAGITKKGISEWDSEYSSIIRAKNRAEEAVSEACKKSGGIVNKKSWKYDGYENTKHCEYEPNKFNKNSPKAKCNVKATAECIIKKK